MFNWFKKKEEPVVTFWSENEIINDLYPIYPAKDLKRKWVKDCAKAFQKYRDKGAGKYTQLTATRCPGIRSITEAGYIMQTWCDIVITTKDGKYEVETPHRLDPVLNRINYDKDILTDFDMRYSPMRIPTGNGIPFILKWHSPYTFEVKEGYNLMILPISYDDNQAFSACPGMTDGFNPNFNVHLYWHETDGRVHLPAGTPLCQLVPVKTGYPIETKIADEEAAKRIRKKEFTMNNTFKRGGTDF